LKAGAATESDLRALDAGADKFTHNDQILLVRGLAGAALRARMFTLAHEYIAKLADLADYDLDSRLLLFDLALRDRDDAAMTRWVEQIRNIEGPKGVLWRYGEASRIIAAAEANADSASVQRAWELLEEARAHRPSWSKIYLNIARVEELQNRPDRAIEAYQSAVELGEHQPEVVSRLVWLLASRGRFLDADRMVRRLEEDAPVPVEMHRLAAEVFARSRDYEAAVEQAQRYVASRPKEYQSHVWLGQMLRLVGRAEEAEKALREGIRVAPNQADAWVPLVFYLARMGRLDDAREVIDEAKTQLPPDQIDAGLAACYEAVGDVKQAESHHKAAIATRADDAAVWQAAADFYVRRLRWTDAETHLRRARELKPDSGAIARSLAVVLVAKGDNPSWQEGLALVEQNMKGGHAAIDDKRTLAMLLALRGEPKRFKEAIQLLEDLVNSASATPLDRHVLAQLHYAQGDTPKGREQMLFLLAQHPENRMFVTTYLKSLLDRGDVRGAQTWMRRLEELDPTSTSTLNLKSRYLQLQGNPAEAAELLQRKVEEIVLSGENTSMLLDIAKLYERLGETGAAGELYRRFRTMKSEGLLPLSSWLAQQGQIDEAIAVCEEAWDNLPAEEVAIPSALIVRTELASDNQQKLIESRIVGALRQNPNSVPLRLALAWLCDSESRYTESMAIYRDVLRSDPKNIFAMNSLAWLVSQCDGNPNEAMKMIDKAIEQHGPVAELLDTRGMIRVKVGQHAQAIEDLENAAAKSPQPHIVFHLAFAYHQAGQKELARTKFGELKDTEVLSRELHWSERPTLRQLAVALRKPAPKAP
jgi:tetratricopeptide (TPR) repeat protein